ncbi:MAG: carbohydrate ABC transporter permease [Armatimonadota bacterium]
MPDRAVILDPNRVKTTRDSVHQPWRGKARRFRVRDTLTATAMLLPATVLILVFHFIPLFYALYISLHKWSLIPERFVGAANYVALLRDQEFHRALSVTLWYVIGTVPVAIGISLVIALMLFRPLWGRGLYRTLYFLPYVTSVVAAAVVWSWIYNPRYGILNYVLIKLGLSSAESPPQWLLEPRGVFQLALQHTGIHLPTWAQGPSLALVAGTIMGIWNAIGFNVIVFLAGLGAIPRELQEAARIDGADEWKVFRHVTLPLLSPTTFFLLIVSTIRAFQAFNQIYVMTRGGPMGTTRTITMYIFSRFYESHEVGYGAAVAVALFLIILAFTMLQFRVAAGRVTYQ